MSTKPPMSKVPIPRNVSPGPPPGVSPGPPPGVSPGPPPGVSTGPPPGVSIPQIRRGALSEKPAPRILLYAIEGWGKTTLASQAPDPLILMPPGEDGYLTLLGEGRVPEVARVELEDWRETLALLDHLIRKPDECKTVVIDGLAGFEALCHRKVCDQEFKGDWGEHGFAAYGRGYDTSIREWSLLLERLDRLRRLEKTILLLAHTEIRSFANPTGPDFDQYMTNLHKRTWSVTKPWPDMILFGTTVTVVSKEKGKAKAIGGTDRVLYTSLTDGYHAKNRHGLPSEIMMPDDPLQMWNTLEAELKGEDHEQA